MQMNRCWFCGSTTRLGVVAKQLPQGGGVVKLGAYCRCKACNARGPLVSESETEYARDLRLTDEKRKELIDKAVTAWNRADNCESGLPLFCAAKEDK